MLRSMLMSLMLVHIIISMDRLFGVDLDVVILFGLFMMRGCMMSCSGMDWLVVDYSSFLWYFWLFLLDSLMFGLFHHDLVMDSSFNRTSKVCGLAELVCTHSNLFIFSLDCLTSFLFKINSDLIVYERNHHAIVERNQRRRLVVLHLRLTLHKYKGSIG